MRTILLYVAVLGCLVKGFVSQTCDIESAINLTTTCSQEFRSTVEDKGKAIKSNPEILCWNFCKLRVCQEKAMTDTHCHEEVKYFIDSNVKIAEVILHQSQKVNCKYYDCNNCVTIFPSFGFTIIVFILLIFIQQNALKMNCKIA
ncbi:uncharacterized protein LOC111089568 isoform X2 [Limulus polyphemus]|uniref:Uncharacterized protein LOC111089568 isoform X2 n=1 Tax=Limulus polyphemus TaxID=6850 RepID=A0ABM1TQ76_LIMPO|nr:uncharacterized protein LOC111089568 isoform X2 [Limulus polyphemus]